MTMEKKDIQSTQGIHNIKFISSISPQKISFDEIFISITQAYMNIL